MRIFIVSVVCTIVVAPSTSAAQSQGRFVGEVVARWLEQDGVDRDMTLVESFEYVAPRGWRWSVPKGAVINGASIPQSLWIFGSPFTGDYRRASVVHDYFCTVRTKPWEEVHRMFYDAAIDGGLARLSAKVMYAGIRMGGPRWELTKTKNIDGREVMTVIPILMERPSERELEDLRQWVETNNPAPEEIEEEVERRLRSK